MSLYTIARKFQNASITSESKSFMLQFAVFHTIECMTLHSAMFRQGITNWNKHYALSSFMYFYSNLETAESNVPDLEKSNF